jgi:hypothetical protein
LPNFCGNLDSEAIRLAAFFYGRERGSRDETPGLRRVATKLARDGF